MQFKVPQFIDVEDKIFGPFTFRQFVYLAGGAGLTFILYKLLPFLIAILFILPVIGLALALAFYKVNNQPFIKVLENSFKFTMQSKLYIWKKEKKKTTKRPEEKPAEVSYASKLSGSKLKDIAWGLDILDVNKKQ
jgi:hypothetical protein